MQVVITYKEMQYHTMYHTMVLIEKLFSNELLMSIVRVKVRL